MTYVIQEPCVGVKDTACVEVCPVDCIYETEPRADTNMLPMFIHNEECIDCGACEPECPVDAIRVDDEAEDRWTQINMLLSEERDVDGGVG
jgi:ferredoxin